MIDKKNSVAKAVRFIYKNIDLPITIEDIANECKMSVSS
jgi:AraC-like DNA-binding protein